jgi:hypothetical protein
MNKKFCERVSNQGKYFQIKCMGGKERKTRKIYKLMEETSCRD